MTEENEFKIEEFSEEQLVKELQTLTLLLKTNFNYSFENLIKIISEEILIPVSIFNEKLSSFESITKYLRENLNLDFKKISELLKRSYRTVWGTYNSSLNKFPQLITPEKTSYLIPVSIFEKKSILETISTYLRENYNLNYREIADLLRRDQRTIWTVINRK